MNWTWVLNLSRNISKTSAPPFTLSNLHQLTYTLTAPWGITSSALVSLPSSPFSNATFPTWVLLSQKPRKMPIVSKLRAFPALRSRSIYGLKCCTMRRNLILSIQWTYSILFLVCYTSDEVTFSIIKILTVFAWNRQDKDSRHFRLLFNPSSLSGEYCASFISCTFPYSPLPNV